MITNNGLYLFWENYNKIQKCIFIHTNFDN